MANVGAEFSLRSITHPLPPKALSVLFDILSLVPFDLAEPFLLAALRREVDSDVGDNAARNVLDKIANYVPDIMPPPPSLRDLPPRLKELAPLAPGEPTVLVQSLRAVCAKCEKEKTMLRERRSSCALGSVAGLRGKPDKDTQLFVLYSHTAGVQYATFQESYCRACKKFFLGGWMFDKPVGKFGKASNIEWVGSVPEEPYFVVPRQQSLYAVDFRLLRFLTDDLNYAGSTFTAATKVWARQHAECGQRKLILGDDLTMLPKTTSNLEDAWFAWQATSLAQGADRGHIWEFSSQGMETSLVQLSEIVRKQHMANVVRHIPECPRCSKQLVLVLDGKCARRRICANMDGFWTMPELGVTLNSGCPRLAPAGSVFCSECSPQEVFAPIPQTSIESMRPRVQDCEVTMAREQIPHNTTSVRQAQRDGSGPGAGSFGLPIADGRAMLLRLAGLTSRSAFAAALALPAVVAALASDAYVLLLTASPGDGSLAVLRGMYLQRTSGVSCELLRW